jgi:hypothetical protein
MDSPMFSSSSAASRAAAQTLINNHDSFMASEREPPLRLLLPLSRSLNRFLPDGMASTFQRLVQYMSRWSLGLCGPYAK